MFFGDEYNVPPCCDQKYFRFLFEKLNEKKSLPVSKEQLKRQLMSPHTEEEADKIADKLVSQVRAFADATNIERSLTSLFMLSDYTLQRVLSHVTLKVPVSTMYLLVPEVSDDLVRVLSKCMERTWFNGKDSKSHILENLYLLVPSSVIENDIDTLRSAFSKFGDRFTIAECTSPSTIIHIKNDHETYLFAGTASQHTGAEAPTLTSLVSTKDPRICKETETVLRLQVNSSKRKGVKL